MIIIKSNTDNRTQNDMKVNDEKNQINAIHSSKVQFNVLLIECAI